MPFHQGDIIPIEQPIYLLTSEGDEFIGALWPLEFFFSERLIVKHEAVVLPEQAFDFVTLFVCEDVKLSAKGVVA